MISLRVLVVAAVVLGLLSYLSRHVSARKRRKGALLPPGPKGLPILGNALDLKNDPYLSPTFTKWYKKYGPIVGFNIMGQKQVLISDEKMLRDLFARRGDIYSDRGRVPAINVIAQGVATFLLDKNDTWRRQRKAMGLAFSLADGAKFESFTDIESKYTLKDIVENPQDFDDHFARYAFSVVTRSSIGHFTRSVQDPYYLRVQQENAFIVNCFRPDKYLCNLAPFLLRLPEWLWKEGTILNRFADNMWQTQLAEQAKMRQRMQDGTAPECFQTRFLANQRQWDLSDHEGVGIFSAFVGGGTRSPHNVMLSFTICMLQHPEWLERLQKHVDDVVGDRLPEFSDMPALPMVRAAAMETLRYRTVHADIGVPHKLAQDDVYEGHFLEKGTLVHANLGAMLRDPKMYPHAETFDPARYLDSSFPTYQEPLSQYPKVRESIGFGVGRRACPGAPFAERSMTIMIARLVWACDIERARDEKGELLPLEVKYEPVVNPRPERFPATFKCRSVGRREVVVREAKEAWKGDQITEKDW